MATMISGLGGAAGYGENSFRTTTLAAGNLDDGAVLVNVSSVFGASGVNFFGTNYTNLYVNSNGLLTFGAAVTGYVPTPVSALTTRAIVPFWNDINIATAGDIYWDFDTVNQRFTVTWLNVASYSGNTGLRNSFQVVMTNLGGGNFNIDIIYEKVQWTTNGTSVTTVGVTNGGTTDIVLEGSGVAASIAGYASNDFDTYDPAGQWSMQMVGGTAILRDGVVEGTAGNDVINASYITDPEGDRIDNNDGMGYAGTTGNADYVVAGAGNDAVTSGVGNDIVFGGTGNDTVTAGDGDDTVYGEADADSLLGGIGNDQLYGGLGNDTLLGEAGNDLLEGSDGDDQLFGGAGNDQLAGGIGNDTLDGGTEADSLLGGAGNDSLLGGTGNDTLLGEAGNDILSGEDGDDSLSGGANNDTLTGGIGNDVLDGGTEADSLLGGDGLDLLQGGDGNDTLLGEAGNDTLQGGAGRDQLTGGVGADLIAAGADEDTIFGGYDDTIDGGETGTDNDVLDLSAWGHPATNVIRNAVNPENGIVQFLDAGGNVVSTLTFTNIETIVVCFTPGTLINTETGLVPVQDLQAGARVLTRDHGYQTLRWAGRRDFGIAELIAEPSLRPIRIAKGALGQNLPLRDMKVSPQHRMLIEGARAELLFGEPEVLIAATHLTVLDGVDQVLVPDVSYIHLMFDRHEIICADGAWSESFQPAERTLNAMPTAQRTEIEMIFPDVCFESGFPAARLSLKKHEARVLLAA